MTPSIPQTQSGYGFKRGQKTIQRYDNRKIVGPKGKEVLLKIEAAGLCLSDLHILLAQETYIPDSFIMGHEIAGQIVAVGEGLEDDEIFEIGGRFAMFIPDACGICDQCRSGRDNTCKGNLGDAYGLSQDGGFQQYLLVKNLRALLPIPDGVSYEQAAITSDAVLTPFHAIQRASTHLKPGAKVLQMGMGGLGINALQILKNFGVYVVVCDIKPEAEELAKKYGADEFWVDPVDSDHLPESFDVCFDFCGFQETFDHCQRFVKTAGLVMVVGLGRSKLMMMNFHMGRREVKVIFSMGGTSLEQIECMEWVAAGKIKPLLTLVDMKDLPKYMEKLNKGEVLGRIVFNPSKL